jgi:hypothetical protein
MAAKKSAAKSKARGKSKAKYRVGVIASGRIAR